MEVFREFGLLFVVLFIVLTDFYSSRKSRKFDKWHRKVSLNDLKTHGRTVQAVGDFIITYEKNPWAARNNLVETVKANLEERAVFDRQNPPPELDRVDKLTFKFFDWRKRRATKLRDNLHEPSQGLGPKVNL